MYKRKIRFTIIIGFIISVFLILNLINANINILQKEPILNKIESVQKEDDFIESKKVENQLKVENNIKAKIIEEKKTDSILSMIVSKDTTISSVKDKEEYQIKSGTIVIADPHSTSNGLITVEYNNNLYFIKESDCVLYMGDKENIESAANKIHSDFESEKNKKEQEEELKKISQGETEYPVATTVWKFLRDKGYNQYVAAGIIGNMMVECGGQTLNLQPYVWGGYNGAMYGLCQWYNEYHPDVIDSSIEVQLQYLLKTIKPEFDVFGNLSGYTYDEFCKITNEKDAALSFAKTYERCGESGGYKERQECAEKALKYFTKK